MSNFVAHTQGLARNHAQFIHDALYPSKKGDMQFAQTSEQD
ncbi:MULTISPECIES: hypothetical protein [unclassified Lysinibacillus]|nr:MULTISPECIES: hypothetical protein [unclassified Lysinibacillus]